jgi:hypothetical protein
VQPGERLLSMLKNPEMPCSPFPAHAATGTAFCSRGAACQEQQQHRSWGKSDVVWKRDGSQPKVWIVVNPIPADRRGWGSKGCLQRQRVERRQGGSRGEGEGPDRCAAALRALGVCCKTRGLRPGPGLCRKGCCVFSCVCAELEAQLWRGRFHDEVAESTEKCV